MIGGLLDHFSPKSIPYKHKVNRLYFRPGCISEIQYHHVMYSSWSNFQICYNILANNEMTKYEPLASTGLYYTDLTEYSMGLSMGTCKRCTCMFIIQRKSCPSLPLNKFNKCEGTSPEWSRRIQRTRSAWRVLIVRKSVTFIKILAQWTGWCGLFSAIYRLKAPRISSCSFSTASGSLRPERSENKYIWNCCF